MAKRGTLDHPKTMDLADRLGIMEPFALGVLEAFWAWVAKYRPDGDLRDTRAALMARAIRYTGDADALMNALLDAKWIDRETMYVHDWHEHSDDAVDNALARTGHRYANGSMPRMRRLHKDERAELVAKFFSPPSAQTSAESTSCVDLCAQETTEDDSVATPCAQKAHRKPLPVASSQKPVASASSQKPEEKISCAEASSAPPVGTLPCLGGKSWPFTQADVDAWQEAYPAVDVLAELRKDREWLKANPRNMKTPGGMRRHVNTWLSRSQNEARSTPSTARSMPQPGYDPAAPTMEFTREDIERFRQKRSRGEPLSPALSELVDRYDRDMQVVQRSGVM